MESSRATGANESQGGAVQGSCRGRSLRGMVHIAGPGSALGDLHGFSPQGSRRHTRGPHLHVKHLLLLLHLQLSPLALGLAAAPWRPLGLGLRLRLGQQLQLQHHHAHAQARPHRVAHRAQRALRPG